MSPLYEVAVRPSKTDLLDGAGRPSRRSTNTREGYLARGGRRRGDNERERLRRSTVVRINFVLPELQHLANRESVVVVLRETARRQPFAHAEKQKRYRPGHVGSTRGYLFCWMSGSAIQ